MLATCHMGWGQHGAEQPVVLVSAIGQWGSMRKRNRRRVWSVAEATGCPVAHGVGACHEGRQCGMLLHAKGCDSAVQCSVWSAMDAGCSGGQACSMEYCCAYMCKGMCVRRHVCVQLYVQPTGLMHHA